MRADGVQLLQYRARILQRIRAFFDARGILEVDTPLLAPATNSDIHIQSIEARVNGATRYLQTSPEFAMKRLLAAGSGSIYQICHAFRDEELGRRHRPEFTLLEWYSVGLDYQQLMDQMVELVCALADQPVAVARISYRDVFDSYLGLDPLDSSIDGLRQWVASEIGGIDIDSLDRNDCLDLLLGQVIAPRFDGFTFVYDYPAQQAALARISECDSSVAERFELFHGDLELANGFGELTDAKEQRSRFEADNRAREALGRPVYPLDERFLSALEQGIPQCSGVALGLERLLMVLLGKDDIAELCLIADD
jgi:lysyl-tRNA synthetase class 2